MHLTGGTLTGPVSGTDLTLSNNLNVDKNVTVGGKITVSDGEYYSMDVLGDEYLYQPSADTVVDSSKQYYISTTSGYDTVDLQDVWTTKSTATRTSSNEWHADQSPSGHSYYMCILELDSSKSKPVVGEYYRLVVDGKIIGKGQCYNIEGDYRNYIDFAGGYEAGGWRTESYLENYPIYAYCGDTEHFDISATHTLTLEEVDPNPNPSSLGWLEATGPQPGHGVSFGMPCSEEGFHLGFPLTLGNGENEEIAIRYYGPQREGDMVRFIPNNDDNSGDGIVIGGGGSVVIGSGESAEDVRNAVGISAGEETTYITSDNTIKFVTGCQNGISNRKLCYIDNDGSMHARNKFSVIEESVTRNTNPSTSQWPNALEICDKNGAVIGYVRGQFINDNYEGVQLETIRTISGTNYYHGVRFEISNTGAYRTSFNQPASVRTGLGLGSLATKNNVSNGLQCVDVSVKYASAVSAGGTATVTLTHAAIAGKMVFGVGAIIYSGWAWNLVSFDIDGFGVNTAVTIKTYWRATSATAANSVTVTVQLLYINANPS